jgi:hypothetical protein
LSNISRSNTWGIHLVLLDCLLTACVFIKFILVDLTQSPTGQILMARQRRAHAPVFLVKRWASRIVRPRSRLGFGAWLRCLANLVSGLLAGCSLLAASTWKTPGASHAVVSAQQLAASDPIHRNPTIQVRRRSAASIFSRLRGSGSYTLFRLQYNTSHSSELRARAVCLSAATGTCKKRARAQKSRRHDGQFQHQPRRNAGRTLLRSYSACTARSSTVHCSLFPFICVQSARSGTAPSAHRRPNFLSGTKATDSYTRCRKL